MQMFEKIVLYIIGDSPRIHVGHMRVERRVGQVHVHLDRDDQSHKPDVAVFTRSEWYNRPRRIQKLLEAGITWWPGRNTPRK